MPVKSSRVQGVGLGLRGPLRLSKEIPVRDRIVIQLEKLAAVRWSMCYDVGTAQMHTLESLAHLEKHVYAFGQCHSYGWSMYSTVALISVGAVLDRACLSFVCGDTGHNICLTFMLQYRDRWVSSAVNDSCSIQHFHKNSIFKKRTNGSIQMNFI